MKKTILTMALLLAGTLLCAAQQTMWVTTGPVRYGFDTQQVGRMTCNAAGDSITIQGKIFAVSDIDSIHLASGLMEYNTVLVDYADTCATVRVAGNIASRVTVDVDSAHVSVVQDSALVTEEIFYTLTGQSEDGSFYQHGDFKASLILDGLTLTSSRGAAITIDDGKRIEVQVNDGTVNTLTDCAGGKQKACFVVEGHTEFKGAGDLVITGNTKHAFKSDEYVELKKSFVGRIIIKDAVNDGFNLNQYLEVKAGSLIVESCGDDAIQIDKKQDTTKEFNGQFIMSGGLVQVLKTGEDCKGIKVEDIATISGGTIEVTAHENALHSKGNMTISGGNIYAYSTTANAVNSAVNLSITGGRVVAYGASTSGYGVRGANKLTVGGGTIAAMAGLNSTPKNAVTMQPVLTYTGKLPQNTSLVLTTANDSTETAEVLALAVGRAYSTSKNHAVLLTMPAITVGNTYTLYSEATLDEEKANWHRLYTGGDAATELGTPIATATAATPFARLNMITAE